LVKGKTTAVLQKAVGSIIAEQLGKPKAKDVAARAAATAGPGQLDLRVRPVSHFVDGQGQARGPVLEPRSASAALGQHGYDIQ